MAPASLLEKIALGMRPVYWSRTRSAEREAALGVPFMELPELFRTSSVVSLHLLHNEQTDGIIHAGLLDLLPSDAILVNTARAEILADFGLAIPVGGQPMPEGART